LKHNDTFHPRSFCLVIISFLFLQILLTDKVHAAWDLHHAAAVEDLLKQYIKTLPNGANVLPPRLFIYQGKAFSRACPQSGIDSPSYCPGDHTVYLETSLGDQVASSFGDFGALSIIAHEFGHAYMNNLKIHPEGKNGELAADSFAGGFARFVETQKLLEPGDIDEARATFASVGDQEVYHHDHHGTPMERGQAFDNGYLMGFQIPGAPVNAPPSPRPTDSKQPEQNIPPSTPVMNSGSTALPFIGLGIAGVFIVLGITLIVTLINKARDNE